MTVHLPQELIIQILLRLPVKSLSRFKSVSKTWLSLISDPHFAKSHFELDAAPTQRLVLFDAFASKFRYIDFNASLHDDHSACDVFNPNSLLPQPLWGLPVIRGSCRGFLLLDRGRDLCVWNPITGFLKQIPFSSIACNMDDYYFIFLCGFGYDPSTDDYLVILILESEDSGFVHCTNRVEFFSLRANRWKEIEDTRLSYRDNCDGPLTGSLFNGAIHWLTRYDDFQRANVRDQVIAAFDLTERSFSEISLPDAIDYGFYDLGVLGEFLSLCIRRGNNSTEIWVMKEYKVQSSWTKSIVVSNEYIPVQCFSPKCFSKSGDIVGIDEIIGLVICDDKGQLKEHRSYGYGYCVAVYTDSLLSLPGDISLPGDSEQAEQQ